MFWPCLILTAIACFLIPLFAITGLFMEISSTRTHCDRLTISTDCQSSEKILASTVSERLGFIFLHDLLGFCPCFRCHQGWHLYQNPLILWALDPSCGYLARLRIGIFYFHYSMSIE